MTVAPQPTTAVNPSKASVAALAAVPDDSPIGMLNLLRYAQGDGAAAYRRYTDVAAGCVGRVGGSAIFMGPVVESDEAWDTAILVYYPRRSAFVEMQKDPAYIGAIPDRSKGLAARLLYPFALPEMSGPAAAKRCAVNGSLTVQLRRWTDSRIQTNGDAEAVFQLSAGGPGLVSDGRWDELVVSPTTERTARKPAGAEATMTLVVSS